MRRLFDKLAAGAILPSPPGNLRHISHPGAESHPDRPAIQSILHLLNGGFVTEVVAYGMNDRLLLQAIQNAKRGIKLGAERLFYQKRNSPLDQLGFNVAMGHRRNTEVYGIQFPSIQHLGQTGIAASSGISRRQGFCLGQACSANCRNPNSIHPGQNIAMHFAEPARTYNSDIQIHVVCLLNSFCLIS
ncbi:hypothetical protein D3C73_1184130 [compost metagenome]